MRLYNKAKYKFNNEIEILTCAASISFYEPSNVIMKEIGISFQRMQVIPLQISSLERSKMDNIP
jgi:hypothetical protein